MCEPISLGAVFASIGSAFKFADLAIRISEVASENEVFVRTIRVVRDDLHEVERLLNVDSVQRKLTSIPGKFAWVKGAIVNTNSALIEIGRWVERARSEQESTGNIQFETRVRWVFNDHEKLLNRKTELMTCHQQLSNVLSYLLRLEDVPATADPLEYIDTTFFNDILSRHRRPTASKGPLTRSNATVVLPDERPKLPASVLMSASNVSKPYSQYSSFDETNTADFTVPYRPERTTSWPDSPPSSPPPTYSSVIRNSDTQVRVYPNPRTAEPLQRISHRHFEPSIKAEEIQQQDLEKTQTWAYRAPSIDDMHTPELAGDSVFLSGTNSLGPVNPFEFSADPVTQVIPKKVEEESVPLGELLGDLTFAVELPTNDPGPPPGYPPRRAIKPSSPPSTGRRALRSSTPLTSDRLRVQRDTFEHRLSAPELPAITARRPLPQHAHSQPPQADASEKIFISTPPKSNNQHAFELPSRLKHPPLTRHLYTSLTGPDQTRKHAPPHTPPQQHHQSHANSSVNQPQQVSTLPPQTSPPPPPPPHQIPQSRTPEPASMARMRRQKDMMDLLSSIES